MRRLNSKSERWEFLKWHHRRCHLFIKSFFICRKSITRRRQTRTDKAPLLSNWALLSIHPVFTIVNTKINQWKLLIIIFLMSSSVSSFFSWGNFDASINSLSTKYLSLETCMEVSIDYLVQQQSSLFWIHGFYFYECSHRIIYIRL